jgi:CRP-like cAMP-binding protein
VVSPELVRRYTFFAGLNLDQITALAQAADEIEAPAHGYIFKEGEELGCFYVVRQGEVGVVVALPGPKHEIVVSSLGPGDMFGWAGLVPPHRTMAGARALTACQLLRFDCRSIRNRFEQDWQFGFVMMERAAQVISERLRDTRMETLAYAAA